MPDTNTKDTDFFDLNDVSKEEQEEFIVEFGDVIMKTVFRKAWFTLDSNKRETLTLLLEESEQDPENEEKYKNILAYLDEHVPNIGDIVKKEVEKIQKAYLESRDAFTDASN